MTLRLLYTRLGPRASAPAARARTRPSTRKAAASSASIRAAEEVGATHDPSAALYLQLAKEQSSTRACSPDSGDKGQGQPLAHARRGGRPALDGAGPQRDDKAAAQGAIDSVKKMNTNVQ